MKDLPDSDVGNAVLSRLLRVDFLEEVRRAGAMFG
jgi:hypothetical protein